MNQLKSNGEIDGGGNSFIGAFTVVTFVFQILMIVVWGITTTFSSQDELGLDIGNGVQPLYSHYLDMVMIVVLGFGLLSSFLKKYSHSSLAKTFFIVASLLQWAILCTAFWRRVESGIWDKININIELLIFGVFGAFSVIITFGVLAGKITFLAMFIVGFIEVSLWSLNYYIGSLVLEADDFGMAIFTHVFGAMFGLSSTFLLSRKWNTRDRKRIEDIESDYNTDFYSLLGTILLWVLFPSINAALAKPATQMRVVINTVLSLCCSCIFSFWVSRTFRRKRFGIRDVQQATIAGGIAMSSSVSSTIIPGASMLVGSIAATFVAIGIAYIKPWLDSPLRKFPIHDSRGSIQLHGIAGIISVFAGIVATSIAHGEKIIFGQSFGEVFRAGSSQAGLQAAALFITIGIALLGGFLTSLFIYFLIPEKYVYFSDEDEWMLTNDFEKTHKDEDYQPISTSQNLDDIEMENLDD